MARSHAVGAAQSRLKELCVIASEATGVSFTPLHAPSYRELAEQIRHGEGGIAWMPPIPAIDLEEDGAATPLALPWRHESASYYSALVTREGRAKGVAELQGMRVAWVDKESAAGYLVPRMHLASLGLDARTFFAQETFAHSHLGVIDAVVSGAADVGATFCTLEPGTKRIMTAGWTAADGSKIRDVDLVATLGPIPNDAIVASSRIPASVRSGLTRWLLAPDDRSQDLLAELFQVRSFRVASSAHFDPLRHMMRAARARGYDA
ncbi:MAG: phosphate/phosphite/phosphonate ABC transporter substrate-binding protein [Polyangiaceae bacterium]